MRERHNPRMLALLATYSWQEVRHHAWRSATAVLAVMLGVALAFSLFALNQFVVWVLGAADERGNYAYVLRVLGFVLILVAIVDKNVFSRKRGP